MSILNSIGYSHKAFPSQLLKIRDYIHITQGEAADRLSEIVNKRISRQLWSHWEKGTRSPNPEQLVGIAKLFQININFFFFFDVQPFHFNSQIFISSNPEKVTSLPIVENSNNLCETYLSKKLFSFLDDIKNERLTSFIKVLPHSGITFSMLHYIKKNKNTILIDNSSNVERILIEINENYSEKLIICDHTSRLPENIIIKVIDQYYKKNGIAIISKDQESKLLDLVDYSHMLGDLTIDDFNRIIKIHLPNIDENGIAFLRLITTLDLLKLMKIIKVLKKSYNGKVLTNKAIYKILNGQAA